MEPINRSIMRCTVVNVTERHEQAWDLVCLSEESEKFVVDPFVGCALPELTDSERRALIGQAFEMSDYWVHRSGVFLCHSFKPIPAQAGKE